MDRGLVYVARRPCGCMVAAMIDDTAYILDEDDAKKRREAISDCVRTWIRAGWRIDSAPADQVPAQWFTVCPHEARQEKLLSVADRLSEMLQQGRVEVSPDGKTITNTITGETVAL